MKYTTTLIILLGIVAVCWAGREYKIYKDQLCVQSYSAYYWTTDACPVKRAVQNECLQIGTTGYYYEPSCSTSANVTIGWPTYILYHSTIDCTGDYDLYAVPKYDETTPSVVWNVDSIIEIKLNVTCNQGTLTGTRCSDSGCAIDAMAYNTCVAFDLYSGKQSSCQGSATPTSSPVATTPAKKSSASVAAFSGFVLLAGLFAF